MPDHTCSVDGCERPRVARGLCLMHYKRGRKSGELKLLPPKPPRVCSIEGCNQPHQARGWCSKHYERWKVHGDPLVTLSNQPGVRRKPAPQGRPVVCKVAGCDRNTHCADLCAMHYSRWRRYGSLEHPHPRQRARPGEHWCSACETYKPVNDFYANRARNSGLSDNCKTCQNVATKAWLNRHPDYRRNQALARRGGISSADSDSFTRQEIAARDGWLCQICLNEGRGKRAARINPLLQWPDPNSLSIDHIIPLNPVSGERGRHVRSNVQAAHLGCNWTKKNKGTDQLRLFG